MTVTHQDIHALLVDKLGFLCGETSDEGPRGERRIWRTYRHPASGASFVFAKKPSNEPVPQSDLESMRAHLDYRGVMNAETFQRFVKNGAAAVAS